jgi:hypothetical protein
MEEEAGYVDGKQRPNFRCGVSRKNGQWVDSHATIDVYLVCLETSAREPEHL